MFHSETLSCLLAQTAEAPPRMYVEQSQSNSGLVFVNIAYSLLSLYMIALLVCWLAPWLNLELRRGPFAWLGRITEPAFVSMRRILPNLGPFDAAPIACVLAVWLLRVVITGG